MSGTNSGIVCTDVASGVTVWRMRDEKSDYELMVRWRNTSHVREWWDPDDPPMTLETAISEYRPDTKDGSATTACIIEVSAVPTGFVQFYPWSAYPEEIEKTGMVIPNGCWGIDTFIGESAQLDRGIGSQTVRMVCDYLFTERGATAVAFGVEVGNDRAHAAYVKAGMTPGMEFLDTDTRGGERTRSILMTRVNPNSA